MDPNHRKKLQDLWQDLVRWREYLSAAFPGTELDKVPEHLRKAIRELEHVDGFEPPVMERNWDRT